jgi:hypothetical protein
MRRHILIVIVLMAGSCSPAPDQLDYPPEDCADAYVATCDRALAVCYRHTSCIDPGTDQPLSDCARTCRVQHRRCYAACPVKPRAGTEVLHAHHT